MGRIVTLPFWNHKPTDLQAKFEKRGAEQQRWPTLCNRLGSTGLGVCKHIL